MPVPASLEAQAAQMRSAIAEGTVPPVGQATPPPAPPEPGQPAGQAAPPAAPPPPAAVPPAAVPPVVIPDNVVDFAAFNDDAALDALLGDDAIPPVIDPAAPPVTVPPVVPPVAVPPVVVPPVDPNALNPQMEEMIGVMAQQQKLIAELQGGVADPAAPPPQSKTVEELVAAAVAAQNSARSLEITDAERERFDDGTIDFVTKLVNKAAQEANTTYAEQITAMQAKIDELQATAPVDKTSARVAAEGMFVNMLAASVPDFDTVVESAGFNEFLARPANAVTGESYRAVLTKAYAAQDAVTARKVFTTFHSAQAANPTLAAMATPEGSNATPEGTLTNGGPVKPMLKLSDLNAAMRLNVQNKAKMPDERYLKIRRLYDVARKEDRVIDDMYVDTGGNK